MSKRITLLLFFYVAISFAQDGDILVVPEEMIQPKKVLYYTDSGNFREGMAPIMTSEGKWGFINKKGKLIIPAQYDGSIFLFFNKGASVATMNDKKFLLDKKGNDLTPKGYSFQSTLDGNFAVIGKEGKIGLMNFSGKILVPVGTYAAFWHTYKSNYIAVFQNQKKGATNLKGDFIIAPKYNQLFSLDGDKGNIFTAMHDNKYGLLDKKGHELTEFKYEDARYFSEGLCGVKLENKYGFINKKGEEIIPFKYDDITDFSEGLAGVNINGAWGVINKKGQLIVPATYTYIHKNHDGLMIVENNKKYGVIDSTGKIIIPVEYELVEEHRKENNKGEAKEENIFPVKRDGKWGLINNKGEFITDVIYEKIFSLPQQRTVVVKDKKWGLLNSYSGKVIVDFKYEVIYPDINENLIKVGINNGFGFIDLEGNEIIPPQYREARNFSEGLASVINESGRVVFINKKNKVVIKPYAPGEEEEIRIKISY